MPQGLDAKMIWLGHPPNHRHTQVLIFLDELPMNTHDTTSILCLKRENVGISGALDTGGTSG